MRKYEVLESDYIEIGQGRCLYRIRALRDFGYVRKGQLGGYIEHEGNLSHEGTCWIWGKSRIFEQATLLDDAVIMGDYVSIWGEARVYENARIQSISGICGKVEIYGKALVCGGHLYGNLRIGDDSRIWLGTVLGGR